MSIRRWIWKVFDGFWMSTAYRIPDTGCACVEPGNAVTKTIPINRFNVRSFITSLTDAMQVNEEAVWRPIC
jgi:sulfite dehydrogenase